MGQLIIIVAMFALLWVLLIRPQRVKQQKQRSLIESVAVGDEILTVGGLYGIVQEIDEEEDDLVVEIAEGIHARIARRAVASVVKPDDEADDELDEDEDEDAEDADFEPLDEAGVTESEDSVRSETPATAGGTERS